MNVPRNSIYGFLGDNGAGKTTTFSLVGGFIFPNRGQIEVNGSIGLLPQDAQFTPGRTIESQLRLLARLDGVERANLDEEIERILKSVGMWPHRNRKTEHCSHGMYKRVGIAQVLLGDPDLILLDEPTAGLDPKSTHDIRNLIKTLNQKKTIVISSHDLAEIEALCDYVGIIKEGEMCFEGPITQWLEHDSVVRYQLSKSPKITDLESRPFILDTQWSEQANELTIRFNPQKTSAQQLNASLTHQFMEQKIVIHAFKVGLDVEQRYLSLTQNHS